MSSAFAEADALERGANVSHIPSVVSEATVPGIGESGNGGNSDGQGSVTTAAPADQDNLNPGHDGGQIGLARLKISDDRFNFYPAFPIGRSLVIDSLAWQIYRILMKMEAQMKKIKAKHHVEPCGLRRGERDRRRWEKLEKKLSRKMQEYDIAFVNAKTVNGYECPREGALKTLQDWLNKQQSVQRHLYANQEVAGFRMLGPRRGPIETFVHETLPTTGPAGFLMRPFRDRNSETEEFTFHGYSERVLNRIGGLVSLLCIGVVIVVPLGFLVFFDLNATVKYAIVLTMFFLVSLLAQVTETDEGRQWLLVIAYLAMMSALQS